MVSQVMFDENRLRGSVKKGPCPGSHTHSQQVRGLGFQTQVFMKSIYTKVKDASLIDGGCEFLERTNRRVVEEALFLLGRGTQRSQDRKTNTTHC